MPNRLSRIQLLWTRFWPPPPPAKASAPSRTAKPSSDTGMLASVATWGASRQASAVTAMMPPTMNRRITAATFTIWMRSRATYTTGARVRMTAIESSIPIAM